MAIQVRLGASADVDGAVSVCDRSNLARRHGVWSNRSARVAEVRALLSESAMWFLLAEDGPILVGMAAVQPLRGDDPTGPPIPGGLFVKDNERSHRLYRSRSFSPTGRIEHGEGEWIREL